MSQAEKTASKLHHPFRQQDLFGLFCFIKHHLLGWAEIPVERSADSLCPGKGATTERFLGTLRMVLAGSFHLSETGGESGQLVQKAFQCGREPSPRSPLALSQRLHTLMLSAGFHPVFQLLGVRAERWRAHSGRRLAPLLAPCSMRQGGGWQGCGCLVTAVAAAAWALTGRSHAAGQANTGE